MNHPRIDAPMSIRVRRGFAVAVVVLLLAIMNIVAFGSFRGAMDEAGVSSLRVETARAFYAAESGLAIVVLSLNNELDLPVQDDVLLLPGAEVRFVEIPEEEGPVIIEGRSGAGRRRISAEIEPAD